MSSNKSDAWMGYSVCSEVVFVSSNMSDAWKDLCRLAFNDTLDKEWWSVLDFPPSDGMNEFIVKNTW